MREMASELRRHDPRRSVIASCLREMRGIDASASPWHMERTAAEYAYELGGLVLLFDYVRKLGKKKILDLGAGTTLGIRELSAIKQNRDIEFVAAVASPRRVKHRDMGNVQIRATPIEVLRGIEDESVGCALSVHGATYSALSRLTAASIDRVLAPGGVVKMTGQAAGHKFFHPFRDIGYDVAEAEPFHPSLSPIFLGIKPGSEECVAAEKLLAADALLVRAAEGLR